IEGQHNNTFTVSLPDGKYTVWLIASDAEWDPPLFEVWANGERKLDVRIPRRAFVSMETFQARAVGGRLQIEFRGPHGWILSALIIGQDGPELREAAARAEHDIFFLTDAEAANWKERRETSDNPPLRLTVAERARGYVAFSTDPGVPITPTFPPARAD